MPADMMVGLFYQGKTTPVSAKIKNIGRGGFFVEIPGELPVLRQELEFRIETTIQGIAEITGTGLVRWARERGEDSSAPGCGIEFLHLDESCLKKVVELINFLKTKSFIPRND